MEGYFFEDREGLERLIHEMMVSENLPPYVKGYDVKFGNYMDGGEPTVWLRLHAPYDTHLDKPELLQLIDVRRHLRQKLADIAPSRLAFVTVTVPPDDPVLARQRAVA